jgi:hypothetical protein
MYQIVKRFRGAKDWIYLIDAVITIYINKDLFEISVAK